MKMLKTLEQISSSTALDTSGARVDTYTFEWRPAAPPDYPYAVGEDAPSVLVCPGCGRDEPENICLCDACCRWLETHFPRETTQLRQIEGIENTRHALAAFFRAIEPVPHARPRPSDGTFKTIDEWMGLRFPQPPNFDQDITPALTKSGRPSETLSNVNEEPACSAANMNYGSIMNWLGQLKIPVHKHMLDPDGHVVASVVGSVEYDTDRGLFEPSPKSTYVTARAAESLRVTAWQLFSADREVIAFVRTKAERSERYAETIRLVWRRDEFGWRSKYIRMVEQAANPDEFSVVVEPELE